MDSSGGVRLGKELEATQNVSERAIDRPIVPYWSDSFYDFARDQGLAAVFPRISLPSNAQKVRHNAPLARLQIPAAMVSADGIFIVIDTGENMSTRRPTLYQLCGVQGRPGDADSDSALEVRRRGHRVRIMSSARKRAAERARRAEAALKLVLSRSKIDSCWPLMEIRICRQITPFSTSSVT